MEFQNYNIKEKKKKKKKEVRRKIKKSPPNYIKSRTFKEVLQFFWGGLDFIFYLSVHIDHVGLVP